VLSEHFVFEAVTPEFLELIFLVMAQRPTEAEAIA
jgi:hypothetical protein